ncbi:TetR/AcrR family transcriptional regulator [Terricaulis sp.]|uniref:TetR/AcrR family transcriptional regulator n=1 Tax=Terricaulis sp. TaxID=2768686 RepID=UPI003784991A
MRRDAGAARDNILNAAEGLLLEQGPLALKLADVAQAANVANASVLHHFGSIDALHAALMERMVGQLIADVMAIADEGGKRDDQQEAVFQALFDVFENRGAARLAAWLELTGEWRRMTHVREAVREVVLRRAAFGDVTPKQAEDLVLISVTLAMGVGLFGRSLAELMGKSEGRTRKVGAEVLRIYHAAQQQA